MCPGCDLFGGGVTITSQRRFVANASHELRTPLATERVLIDEALADRSAIPDDLQTILEQLLVNREDTERLIDTLLALARSERGIEHWTPVDLTSVVASVLDQSAAEAAVAGVSVSSTLEAVAVNGDPGLLERLAGNLVENAIRHNANRRDGCHLRIFIQQVGRSRAGGREHRSRAGTRLRRRAGRALPAGRSRSASNDGGVGLGLSIVNAVVTAHHGTMTLRARQKGGLHVRVQPPVAQLPPHSPQPSQSLPSQRHQTNSSRRPDQRSRHGRAAKRPHDPNQ